MTTVKSHRFPVSIEWQEGRLTRASAADKPDLEIATPPEFKHGIPGVWSPEDLLVASTAACYAVTLLAIAERRGVQPLDLSVAGTGHVEQRADGRFGFIAIELDVRLAVSPEEVETAERVARYAKDACLVSLALSTPVDVYVHVEARELALA
jgi:organic hydroperoxide reductase OsmC/OhrA